MLTRSKALLLAILLVATQARSDGITNPGGTGGVTSISNSDGTLTISPTTGAAVASIALGHANTWTAGQTFPSGTVGSPGVLIGSGQGFYSRCGGCLDITDDVGGGGSTMMELFSASAGSLTAKITGAGILGWTSGDPSATGMDTALSRDSAGVIDIGNGSASDKSGSINATGATLTGTLTAKRITGNTNSVPTANSCAGFSLATGSSDFAGKVSFTSATSCSITFGASFTNAPFCTVSPGSAASSTLISTTTGGLSATFGTANTSMYYICAGS